MVGGRWARGHRGEILAGGPDQKKFTEPVALSSTSPVNLRLPPTALGSGFDLLALRARCKRELRGCAGTVQGLRNSLCRNLRKLPRAQTELAFRAVRSKGAGPEFTEPVALSSTSPVNLRLPPTALGSGFDLLALRARCKGEANPPAVSVQEGGNPKKCARSDQRLGKSCGRLRRQPARAMSSRDMTVGLTPVLEARSAVNEKRRHVVGDAVPHVSIALLDITHICVQTR